MSDTPKLLTEAEWYPILRQWLNIAAAESVIREHAKATLALLSRAHTATDAEKGAK